MQVTWVIESDELFCIPLHSCKREPSGNFLGPYYGAQPDRLPVAPLPFLTRRIADIRCHMKSTTSVARGHARVYMQVTLSESPRPAHDRLRFSRLWSIGLRRHPRAVPTCLAKAGCDRAAFLCPLASGHAHSPKMSRVDLRGVRFGERRSSLEQECIRRLGGFRAGSGH